VEQWTISYFHGCIWIFNREERNIHSSRVVCFTSVFYDLLKAWPSFSIRFRIFLKRSTRFFKFSFQFSVSVSSFSSYRTALARIGKDHLKTSIVLELELVGMFRLRVITALCSSGYNRWKTSCAEFTMRFAWSFDCCDEIWQWLVVKRITSAHQF